MLQVYQDIATAGTPSCGSDTWTYPFSAAKSKFKERNQINKAHYILFDIKESISEIKIKRAAIYHNVKCFIQNQPPPSRNNLFAGKVSANRDTDL